MKRFFILGLLLCSAALYADDCSDSFNEAKDNWLLNIELYSGEIFRSDIAAIWMQEMRIPDTQDFYSLVRFYKSFFAN